MKRGAVLGVVLVWTVTVGAETRAVPGQYPTIQAAISASHDGDTVLVSPGTYRESIRFTGKDVTVRGTDPNDWQVVARTIIDAGGTGSVVSFINGEDRSAVLTGFTLTGGGGAFHDNPLGPSSCWGGGILCLESGPTIARNIIEANGNEIWPCLGGGIASYEGDPVINQNIMRNNVAFYGGGLLALEGEAVITNNWIYDNSAYAGAGVFLMGGDLIGNTIVDNEAEVAANLYWGSSDVPASVGHNIFAAGRSGFGVMLDGVDPENGLFWYNDAWGNMPGDYLVSVSQAWTGGAAPAPDFGSLTGLYGNISVDPTFRNAAGRDYHLAQASGCRDAGDPNRVTGLGETDIDGDPRVLGQRADIGADEFSGCTGLARAGQDRSLSRAQAVILDGSASSFCDPCGPQVFCWRQTAGPTVDLMDANSPTPSFMAAQEAEYRFELVIGTGSQASPPDEVVIVIHNNAPVAEAGPRQTLRQMQAVVDLDGSRSSDPDHDPITYRWQQVEGPQVTLARADTTRPSFAPPALGTYAFELVVNDGLINSASDRVVVVLGQSAPVADAGPVRYAGSAPVRLDGTGSRDPDGDALGYRWRQISGPALTLTGADSSMPTVGGFVRGKTVQYCRFELVVDDGTLESEPDTVDVIIVEDYGTKTLTLGTPPFDPNKPTILSFGGGDCVNGTAMQLSAYWSSVVNFFTTNYSPDYYLYADWLIAYLSNVAPGYRQPIQTMGFSTGGLPAVDVAIRLNCVYGDRRYAVNRISFLDVGCRSYQQFIVQLISKNLTGESCWIDNYYSQAQTYLPGVLNIAFPGADHSTPRNWYATTCQTTAWPGGDLYNNGATGGYYLSVAGPAKNLRLAADTTPYYFRWVSMTGGLRLYDPEQYPGLLPEAVTLIGPVRPAEGVGVVLTCRPSRNAVRYELLVGNNPDDVDHFAVWSDTPTPPQGVIESLPHDPAWWTIRVSDAYGSTLHQDPVRISLSETRTWPVSNLRSGRAYPSIGMALEDAEAADTIVVQPGTYHEILKLQTKDITLRSVDPNDLAVVAATVIAGDGTGPAIEVTSGGQVVLRGLTLSEGKEGLRCTDASPRVDRCRIVGNLQYGVRVVGYASPVMTHCLIAANSAHGVEIGISRNRISTDKATLDHCIVVGNGRYGVHGNYADLIHCTVAENIEGGVWGEGLSVSNSILYFNGPADKGPQIQSVGGVVTYCDVQGGRVGQGNLDADPEFARRGPDGDYHLRSQAGRWDPAAGIWVLDQVTSPCVDAGDPSSDFSHEPLCNGGRANLGAYGNTSEASQSP